MSCWMSDTNTGRRSARPLATAWRSRGLRNKDMDKNRSADVVTVPYTNRHGLLRNSPTTAAGATARSVSRLIPEVLSETGEAVRYGIVPSPFTDFRQIRVWSQRPWCLVLRLCFIESAQPERFSGTMLVLLDRVAIATPGQTAHLEDRGALFLVEDPGRGARQIGSVPVLTAEHHPCPDGTACRGPISLDSVSTVERGLRATRNEAVDHADLAIDAIRLSQFTNRNCFELNSAQSRSW